MYAMLPIEAYWSFSKDMQRSQEALTETSTQARFKISFAFYCERDADGQKWKLWKAKDATVKIWRMVGNEGSDCIGLAACAAAPLLVPGILKNAVEALLTGKTEQWIF